MTDYLPLHFFRYSNARRVSACDPAWLEPLPIDRYSRSVDADLTLGSYFLAVADFLNGEGRKALWAGVSARLGDHADLADLTGVEVILEKHGAFYHPARIHVRHPDGDCSLALNVAISEPGRRIIVAEYENLRRLRGRGEDSGLPAVFGVGTGRSEGRAWPMFLGEWLEGFCEFHLSRKDGGDLGTIVWGPGGVNYFLTCSQSARLYREIARLLTRHYDLDSYDQIFPWHHAAGDFVVRAVESALDVRLVTVRQYGPMFSRSNEESSEDTGTFALKFTDDVAAGLEGLLLFLANLTLRNRMDRLDGVGELTLGDPWVIEASVAGVLAGLVDRSLPAASFRGYLRERSPGQLAEAFLTVAEAWRPDAPETEVLSAGLGDHILSFWDAVHHL